MTEKKAPLELELLISGEVNLLNADRETVWTSDGDNDFWEFLEADFAEENDLDEILAYLEDTGVITAQELESFENGEFDIIVEEPEDGADLSEDAEDDEEDEDEE